MGELFAAVEFKFLPNPVDIGFVGTASAVGGVLVGLIRFYAQDRLPQITERAGAGALIGGFVGLCVWFAGFMGLELP